MDWQKAWRADTIYAAPTVLIKSLDLCTTPTGVAIEFRLFEPKAPILKWPLVFLPTGEGSSQTNLCVTVSLVCLRGSLQFALHSTSDRLVHGKNRNDCRND